MGATKIMIVRHAEKPGIYNSTRYSGVNSVDEAGDRDHKACAWCKISLHGRASVQEHRYGPGAAGNRTSDNRFSIRAQCR